MSTFSHYQSLNCTQYQVITQVGPVRRSLERLVIPGKVQQTKENTTCSSIVRVTEVARAGNI